MWKGSSSKTASVRRLSIDRSREGDDVRLAAMELPCAETVSIGQKLGRALEPGNTAVRRDILTRTQFPCVVAAGGETARTRRLRGTA